MYNSLLTWVVVCVCVWGALQTPDRSISNAEFEAYQRAADGSGGRLTLDKFLISCSTHLLCAGCLASSACYVYKHDNSVRAPL